jgi:YfiH family protein
MFEALKHDGKLVGFTRARGRHFYFFGTRHATENTLTALFPHYDFCFLKQVHGRMVVAADYSHTLEADGHFTSRPNVALVVKSADCLPVLMSSADQVCAVHAGWRGMAANIIAAALDKIKTPEFVAIGPHISRTSFEVGRDVAETLLQASPDRDLTLISPLSEQKVLFDLRRLATQQLASAAPEIEECCFDTKTSELFHSYRRGKEKADRQYSFVVLTR